MQSNNLKTTDKKEESSIVQMAATYLPYWPVFLVFLLLSVVGSVLYLKFTVPKYEATASIIIKDEKKGYDDSKFMESLDLINSKKIIENEIEVLQSRTLMNKVVKKLHLYAPIFQSGNINSITAYTSSPIKVEVLNPDSMMFIESVPIKYDKKNNVVLLGQNFTGIVNQWLQTPYGTLRFISNKNFSGTVTDEPFFFSLYPVKSITAGILSTLKVSASSKLSSVIDLSYRNESPKVAEDVLNELMITYGETALSDKNTLAKNTLSFIEDRLNIVSKDLDSIETKLQRYKTGRGAIDISKQGQLYLENVSTNDKRLSDLNMQVSVMDQLEKFASAPGNIGMLPSTLGVNDPVLNQQMTSLSSLQMQYDKLKTTVAENNPLLTSINEQINQIKPTILNNIQSQRKSLEKNRSNLYTTGGMYNSVLSSIPQKERQLVEISRDQNIKNGIYSFLLQKREESELSYASTLSDSRVVNYSQASNSPVSPKKIFVYLIAIAIAIGLPLLFISAKEVLSPKILYRNEIESLTNIPVLGEIAYNKTKKQLVVVAGIRTFIAEEFRKIRISLLYLGINSTHRKVLITSSISGEGKSFIAANLATSISLTGKRVVLVDLDLHNPGLGNFFPMLKKVGVSDFLIGKQEISDIIQSVPDNNNLSYISSGTLQQDASELLENGKIKNLISFLDENFDMVIIDSAPVVFITDAYLLSPLCDATLYVIRHKLTPKIIVKRIDETLHINPINNPGIIFNGVKKRGFFKSNYGYGYDYVYTYGKKIKKEKNAMVT